MSAQRRRRWTSKTPALGQRLWLDECDLISVSLPTEAPKVRWRLRIKINLTINYYKMFFYLHRSLFSDLCIVFYRINAIITYRNMVKSD